MKSIGFIGLGKMGVPMVNRLLPHYTVNVYNRTKSKATKVIEKGANWVDTPDMIGENSDIVIIMVTDDEACKNVITGKDGLIKSDHRGLIVLNMSTIQPSTSISFAEELKKYDMIYLEAPVSGTVGPAKQGTLTVLLAGDQDDREKVLPVLQNLGNHIYSFDNIGDAMTMKLLINLNLAAQISIFSETMAVAKKLKVNRERFLEIINNSAVATIISKIKGPKMLDGEFPTAFPFKHMLKDLRYGINLVKETPHPMFVSSTVKELYSMSDDVNDKDFSAILEVLENL